MNRLVTIRMQELVVTIKQFSLQSDLLVRLVCVVKRGRATFVRSLFTIVRKELDHRGEEVSVL